MTRKITNKSPVKTTTVREHPRQVPVSHKNPTGITIVDRHHRRLPGTSLSLEEIRSIFKNYDRTNLIYPSINNLKYKNGNKFDEIIAIWTDYFNKVFNLQPPLDPNVVKALIATESGFNPNPPGNKIALGIAQITKETLKILQDVDGEAKEFIFNGIRLKDLKDPEVAIPLAVRWLVEKQESASAKLNRLPTVEELILEYKGLLHSKTSYRDCALSNFREKYEQLKKR